MCVFSLSWVGCFICLFVRGALRERISRAHATTSINNLQILFGLNHKYLFKDDPSTNTHRVMHIYVDVVVISQRVKPKKRREKTEKNREKMKILQFKLNASFFDMCVRRLVVIMFACFTCKLLRSIRSNKNHFHFVVFFLHFSSDFASFVTWCSKDEKKTHNCRCSCPMNRLIPSRNKYVYCLQHAYNTQRHIRMRF